jgi:hypothetical protein
MPAFNGRYGQAFSRMFTFLTAIFGAECDVFRRFTYSRHGGITSTVLHIISDCFRLPQLGTSETNRTPATL